MNHQKSTADFVTPPPKKKNHQKRKSIKKHKTFVRTDKNNTVLALVLKLNTNKKTKDGCQMITP